jgi:hypothetical protein
MILRWAISDFVPVIIRKKVPSASFPQFPSPLGIYIVCIPENTSVFFTAVAAFSPLSQWLSHFEVHLNAF